ncbi:DUF167 domain-containing protein [Candidatus Dependentiae bacterium]|nr:DUF167 domain-containing protein [Candidatus Dependentiae bacterium]
MSLIVEIKVVPSSGRQRCSVDKSGAIKCYLKSAPEKGKANYELVGFLSKRLGISKREITILTGATTRKKRLKFDVDLTLEQFFLKLGIELQKSI